MLQAPLMRQPQQRHRKTVNLTPQGLQKLEAAKFEAQSWKNYPHSFTLETLSECTGLSPHTLSKIHIGKAAVDLRTLTRYFSAFNLTLELGDYIPSLSAKTNESVKNPLTSVLTAEQLPLQKVSWGIAPDVSRFYGRTSEVANLKQWVLDDYCRLITLLGTGGVGKTWLATKLVEQVQHKFDFVIWHSLQPLSQLQPLVSLNELTDSLIRYLSPESKPDLPKTICAKIQKLMDCMRRSRCLLVLDNFDSVLQTYPPRAVPGNGFVATYQSDSDAYGEFLKQVGRGQHQSCLVLTSRKEPQQVQQLSGDDLCVRVAPIKGLKVAEIRQIFNDRGRFQGNWADWVRLVNYYDGNPLILEIAATTIQCLFDGDITEFLKQNTLIFDEIHELLAQQFEYLTIVDKEIMKVLATQNTPLSFRCLRSRISPSISTVMLLESLKSLKIQSILERTAAHFFLPPLLRDYVRESFVVSTANWKQTVMSNH
jgi:transcriptional regulator with XRE-family HTH domain